MKEEIIMSKVSNLITMFALIAFGELMILAFYTKSVAIGIMGGIVSVLIYVALNYVVDLVKDYMKLETIED